MRTFMTVALACGGIAIWSASALAQSENPTDATPARQEQTFCYDGAGPAECVSTTPSRYNECANLAVERGNITERRGYEFFIYQCLTGNSIPK
jgi:hypothetical protein